MRAWGDDLDLDVRPALAEGVAYAVVFIAIAVAIGLAG